MKAIKLITDAAVIKESSKYKGRAGIIILDTEDNVVRLESVGIGNVTSNEGEYKAMLEGLEHLVEEYKKKRVKLKMFDLRIYTDSFLVYNQLLENYRTKKRSFIIYQNGIKKLCKLFKGVKVVWHHREADLAMLADFGSKHPRRTRTLYSKHVGKPVTDAIEHAANLLLKDEQEQPAQEVSL